MYKRQLYPSIKAKPAGKLVYNEVRKTKLQFENINYDMAIHYIAKAAKSNEEVEFWGTKEFCPVRTFKPGSRPGMTGDSDTDDKWTEGKIPETEVDKRKVLGKVLEIAVLTIYKNNVYTFRCELKVEKDGSGEIGRLETGETNIKIKEVCEINNLSLIHI